MAGGAAAWCGAWRDTFAGADSSGPLSALDPSGRKALLHYVLRPPVAQERVEQRPDGLVRITLK
jgi:hypothetical protein